MEHKMLWGAFAVGSAGWVCLLLLATLGGRTVAATDESAREGRAFQWAALALPVVVWLATLPAKAPFSSGQGWGRGFLLGGVIASLSCFLVLGAGKVVDRGKHFALASLFGGIALACVPLIWMRYAITEALLGAALGWCAVSLLWLCASRVQYGHFIRGAEPSRSLGLLNGTASVTALCSFAALAVYRDFSSSSVPRGTYSAVALVLSASVALVLLFGVFLSDVTKDMTINSHGLDPVVAPLSCLVVPFGVGFYLSTHLLDDLKVVYCLGIGAVLGLLGWALAWDARRRELEGWVRSTSVPPLAVLVALCAFMLAYSFLQGYGVGLMIVAAWPASLLLWPSTAEAQPAQETVRSRFDVARMVSLIGAFLVVLLVSRVFATRFRADLRGADLMNQFALFGFLAGALLPAWLASLWFDGKARAREHCVASLLQLGGIGLLSLLLPSAVLAVWGIKVLPALFAGLALSLAGWQAEVQVRSEGVALFALALALALTQWTQKFLPLAEATRAQRIHFLLWGVGGAIVLVVVFDLSARLLLWLQGRSRGGGGKATPEISR